ncbi:MAG: hypothetical protein ACT4OE_01775 [Sphingosinicella sp.]
MAIVGHRAARIVDAEAVKERIAALLALVGPAGDVRLVSALAEGADRLAAAAALEADLKLEVALPFPADEYERDFEEPESLEEFRHMLGRATSVLVLDGAAGAREAAYEAVGRALLDNGDLLFAVWDGGPGRGPGGTREVVAEAVRRGLPVVTIGPDGKEAELLAAGQGGIRPLRLEDAVRVPVDNLAAIADRIATLPARAEVEAHWLTRWRRPYLPSFHRAYPWLLRLVGAGPKKRRPGAGAPATAPALPNGPLRDAFNWWDDVAIYSAQAFRSAVIVNFALAALAVVIASASLLAGAMKWFFVLAEVVVILLLLVNNWYANRQRWQERWLESRQVAEMLRVTLLLRGAGIGRGIAADGGWGAAYVAALARGEPLAAVDLSDPAAAARPLVAEIEGQGGWNETTAGRMRRAGHRIERVGEILFLACPAGGGRLAGGGDVRSGNGRRSHGADHRHHRRPAGGRHRLLRHSHHPRFRGRRGAGAANGDGADGIDPGVGTIATERRRPAGAGPRRGRHHAG